MKVVSELTGAELDYLVGVVNDELYLHIVGDRCYQRSPKIAWEKVYSPSTDWLQGGPIIERERIQYTFRAEHRGGGVFAQIGTGRGVWGETILIACMRCLVASKSRG